MRTILLGAGASAEAGVSTAKQMAREIYDNLRQDSRIADAMDIAIGGLKSHRAIISGRPFEEIDVEDLYEVLKLLGDRQAHLLAPFVGSWSHVIASRSNPDVGQAIREAVGELQSELEETLRSRRGAYVSGRVELHRFGVRLAQAIELATDGNTDTFVDAAEAVLRSLVRLCWIDSETRVGYLAPLIESSARTPLWIASLNYDNSIELAARRAGIEVSIGISPKSSAVAFPNGLPISLAKLHGSVNWTFNRELGQWVIEDKPSRSPALVFGSGNKLTVDGPFLDLLFAFRTQLESSNSLEVCGYSFRDSHVNYLILNWLTKDSSRQLKVFDPALTLQGIYDAINATIAPLKLNYRAIHQQISITQIPTGVWARN